jgi:hypothetical protein
MGFQFARIISKGSWLWSESWQIDMNQKLSIIPFKVQTPFLPSFVSPFFFHSNKNLALFKFVICTPNLSHKIWYAMYVTMTSFSLCFGLVLFFDLFYRMNPIVFQD